MIFIEVRCDKCGKVGLSRRCFYAHQMREELKKAGWKHVAEGGKDFCPKCKPRRKPRRRSLKLDAKPICEEHNSSWFRRSWLAIPRWTMRTDPIRDGHRRCTRHLTRREEHEYAWIQVGTIVDYHAIMGGPITKAAMVVSEPAQRLSGGQWVCWLRGKAGCVSCDAVTPVAP